MCHVGPMEPPPGPPIGGPLPPKKDPPPCWLGPPPAPTAPGGIPPCIPAPPPCGPPSKILYQNFNDALFECNNHNTNHVITMTVMIPIFK